MKGVKLIFTMVAASITFTLYCSSCIAQQVKGELGSPSATTTIKKLTFDLEPVQLTEEDRKQLPAISERVAGAKD